MRSQLSGFVVTIDGPAGAGKSSVAHQLAERLGFDFLDTGAMYRCVTLAVQRSGIHPRDDVRVAELAKDLQIELQANRVLLNGEDVSEAIRDPSISQMIGAIADNLNVRRVLSDWQRLWARGRRVVTEGRDQGTEVFKDAACKIFLVASREERARRRVADLASRGVQAEYAEVLSQQETRDREDYNRPVGSLRKADNAIEVCTDGLPLKAVVDQLEQLVHRHMSGTLANSQAEAESGSSATTGKSI